MPFFLDRKDAGQQLAEALKKYSGQTNTIILGLPRGGVVVASEIAKILHLPLDIIISRKIAVPHDPEFAIGAIDETGEGIWDATTIKLLKISQDYLKKSIKIEKAEAKRRLILYRSGQKPLALQGKTVILIDDGIATGLTMRAAIRSVKKKGTQKVIVAIPVIAADSIRTINAEADELIYLEAPEEFGAVARFYQHFEQTTDEEVIETMINPKTPHIYNTTTNRNRIDRVE
jgi:putative phosphoribosyl transferase